MRWRRGEITAGALLLWALLYYLDSSGMVPQVLAACALHELGHYAAIHLLGGRVSRLNITCVGAEMVLSARFPLGPARELAAALAGPAVNLLCAGLCAGLGERWYCFAGIHLALGLFNLLPVGRLDGGRVLRCALSWLLGPERAWGVCRSLDWMLAGALAALGAVLAGLGSGPTLLLTALWLWSSLFREDRPGPRPASPASLGLLRRISQKIH